MRGITPYETRFDSHHGRFPGAPVPAAKNKLRREAAPSGSCYWQVSGARCCRAGAHVPKEYDSPSVAQHPSRGKEQAEMIWRNILAPALLPQEKH
jgi:hypothetical protein